MILLRKLCDETETGEITWLSFCLLVDICFPVICFHPSLVIQSGKVNIQSFVNHVLSIEVHGSFLLPSRIEMIILMIHFNINAIWVLLDQYIIGYVLSESSLPPI